MTEQVEEKKKIEAKLQIIVVVDKDDNIGYSVGTAGGQNTVPLSLVRDVLTRLSQRIQDEIYAAVMEKFIKDAIGNKKLILPGFRNTFFNKK